MSRTGTTGETQDVCEFFSKRILTNQMQRLPLEPDILHQSRLLDRFHVRWHSSLAVISVWAGLPYLVPNRLPCAWTAMLSGYSEKEMTHKLAMIPLYEELSP